MAKKATKKPAVAGAKKSAGSTKNAKNSAKSNVKTNAKSNAKSTVKSAPAAASKKVASKEVKAKAKPEVKVAAKVSKVLAKPAPKANAKSVEVKEIAAVVAEKVKPQALTAAGKAKVPVGTVEASAAAADKAAKKKDAMDTIKIDRENVKWPDLKKKFGDLEARNYNMREVYEVNRPIVHKVLGWGFIIQVLNDRLDVVFEQGIKQLISNYNPA